MNKKILGIGFVIFFIVIAIIIVIVDRIHYEPSSGVYKETAREERQQERQVQNSDIWSNGTDMWVNTGKEIIHYNSNGSFNSSLNQALTSVGNTLLPDFFSSPFFLLLVLLPVFWVVFKIFRVY